MTIGKKCDIIDVAIYSLLIEAHSPMSRPREASPPLTAVERLRVPKISSMAKCFVSGPWDNISRTVIIFMMECYLLY